jgi:hypothetical protein
LSGFVPEENVDDDDHVVVKSLKGVRFKALSAPGPSGARPEHLRELLDCSNKRTARVLANSVSAFVDTATHGKLVEDTRFILDSRLVFLKKKRGSVPRPIRVGELWRRVVAKRLLYDNKVDIAAVCKDARQFGVGFPGGADVLIHFRTILEKVCR